MMKYKRSSITARRSESSTNNMKPITTTPSTMASSSEIRRKLMKIRRRSRSSKGIKEIGEPQMS
jgi:hypothetical protein